jgi:hypothetical protein
MAANNDMTELGSDATQVLGPMQSTVAAAFKTAQMMAKAGNPKVAEKLADQLEDIIKDANSMKKLLTQLQQASK